MKKTIFLLLSASPHIKNKDGKTPLDMAKEVGAQQFIKIFENK